MIKKKSTKTKTYTTFAAFMGLMFPLFALFIDSIKKDITFSLVNIGKLHVENPIHLVIDTAPFIMAMIVFLLTKKLSKNTEIVKDKLDIELQKSERNSFFAERLRNGEVNANYEMFDKNDTLAKSLINLRDELKNNKEEENTRKKEDGQRSWTTGGLAKFGEILRKNNNDMEVLSYNIISNLVKYLGVNQGGFFILNDDDSKNIHFELKANYAFERKKFANKKVEFGEGLVGASAAEKQTVFISEVPHNYINITSGLGKSNPRCILIVPLILNGKVYGVIEFASFKILEKYQVAFVEKVGESIASTLANYKINNKTALLLKDSQKQAEKLVKQEEAVRKNVEELRKTQREAAKQAESFVSFTNSVNHTLIRAEYNKQGELLYANTKFVKKLAYSTSAEIMGKHISTFINPKDLEWFNKIWTNLAGGGKHFEGDMKHMTKDKQEIWTMTTYVNVRDKEGGVDKILFLGIDITEQKKKSLDYQGQINALNRFTLKAEFSIEGHVLNYNQKLLDILSYLKDEVKEQHITNFLDMKSFSNFYLIWDNIVKGISYENTIKFTTRTGEIKWLNGTFTVVRDMYDDVNKVIFIANDISIQKAMEIRDKKQSQTLKLQEEKLQLAKQELSIKLERTREEVKEQFKEIETVKLLHEETLEGMLDAIISINQNNKIVFFNSIAEDLFKIDRDEILNKHITKLLPMDLMNKENYMGMYFRHGYHEEIIGTRTEVFIVDKEDNIVNVLLTISEAKVNDNYMLTAFIQNIEVELF